MLGIGFMEMVIIAGVALVVIGPEKFPDFAKTFIRMARDLRSHWDDIKRDVGNELKPLDKELRQLTKYDPQNYLKSLSETKPESDATPVPPVGETLKATQESGIARTESEVSDEVWDKDLGPYPYSGSIIEANHAAAVPSSGEAEPEKAPSESADVDTSNELSSAPLALSEEPFRSDKNTD